MSLTLHSSPLQGFTDYRFRNGFNKFFGGIDFFYAPYIRLHGRRELKRSEERDILPKNNSELNLIPQIMTRDADEFLFVAKHVESLGYNELNWNLGCPYPMVAKRGMGSGLIKYPDVINDVLQKVCNESEITISVKIRLGYEDEKEILKVLPVLDKYPLKNIAIHPRIGRQLYKGKVDLDAFQNCLNQSRHSIIYNGDITSLFKYQELKDQFPSVENWMIGRGLISDPFLPQMVKNNESKYPENRIEQFSKFHDTLLEDYQLALSGPSHLIMRMYHFWTYFISTFPNSKKGLKKIKKSKNLNSYLSAVKEILAEA